MSEAKEGGASLEDIDEHTFVRFCQYAYTGDYVTAEPEILRDSSTITATLDTTNKNTPDAVEVPAKEAPPPVSDVEFGFLPEEPAEIANDNNTWGTFSVRTSDKKKSKKKGVQYADEGQGTSRKSELWHNFRNKTYDSESTFQARKNGESCEDYTEVFLCHARLHVFADKYDITPLKRLSLHKLHQTLVNFKLYDKRIGDVVALIRYSYSNENTADLPGSIDDLRQLVIQYAACVVEDLRQNSELESLLEQPGPLARDLFGQMLKRLD